tara:strand:+ start:211 stop:420 length:210 start_codon:yes stop_codon:yes gene_type:complete
VHTGILIYDKNLLTGYKKMFLKNQVFFDEELRVNGRRICVKIMAFGALFWPDLVDYSLSNIKNISFDIF